MKLIKFFLAMIAGFGLAKFFKRFMTEAELNNEDIDIYDDEQEYPLFV